MQMRQEQQKHHYMLASGGNFYMPMYHNAYLNQQKFSTTQGFPQTTADGVHVPAQSQTSQANIPMNLNQMGTLAQSMPQIPQTFSMATTNAVMNQMPANVQTSMNPSVHTSLSQQLPIQSQMHMSQMQMRMSMAGGVHQMLPSNITNGIPAQNLPQQNGQQQQLPKQNFPNQTTHPHNPAVSQLQIGQPVMPQPNSVNPAMSMQMQNRLHMIQNQAMPNQISVSGYPMAHQQLNPQASGVHPQMTIPNQGIPLPGQPMLPGQQFQNQPSQQPATSQNLPGQASQPATHIQGPSGQPMSIQGQPQMLAHPQSLPPNGQHVPVHHQMMNQQMQMTGQLPIQGQGHSQLHGQSHQPIQNQNQPTIQSQGLQQPQNQIQQQMPPAPSQGQGQQQNQVPQQPSSLPQQFPQQAPPIQQPQQQIKLPQQNIAPPQAPVPQQPQTPIKSENNNNTAELISFD